MTTEVLIRKLLFADDAATAAHSEKELQRLADRLTKACDLFGLTIRVKKTEVIAQRANSPPEIRLGCETLETAEKFVYLGSAITSNYLWMGEITSRIGKATAAFERLVERAWKNKKLGTKNQNHHIPNMRPLNTSLWKRDVGSVCWLEEEVEWFPYETSEKTLTNLLVG